MSCTSYSGTLWWYSNKARIDELHACSPAMSWNFQSIWEWNNSGRKRETDKARQAVFFTPLNPFGNDRDEEKPHFDYTVPQKVHYETYWKRNQERYWIKLSRAQDQGLRYWQTKSFAIITYATVPGDCIDRVTSQNGDRVHQGQHPRFR